MQIIDGRHEQLLDRREPVRVDQRLHVRAGPRVALGPYGPGPTHHAARLVAQSEGLGLHRRRLLGPRTRTPLESGEHLLRLRTLPLVLPRPLVLHRRRRGALRRAHRGGRWRESDVDERVDEAGGVRRGGGGG